MRNGRPIMALVCVATLAGIIAGCGASAPQAAATPAPGLPAATATAPAGATQAPTATAPAGATQAPTVTAPAGATQAPTVTAPAGATQTSTPGGSQASATATPPPLGGAASAVPQATIDAIIADLAKMTGVDPSQIALVSAEAVTWRDGSLGCPRPGMMYPQVLSEGFRVVLAAGGKEYAYHGGDRGPFFYCASPSR